MALAGPGIFAAVPHGNIGRTAYVDAELTPPFRAVWRHTATHPPRPAWREPGWEPQRIDFDYVHAVSGDGDTVFYASASDHALHALDLSNGQERWVFRTDAPVRLAPEFHGEHVLVASDDGTLYCLKQSDGAAVWTYRPRGIPDERLLGNEQMISRWPCRSGVLVEADRVYCTFGMLAQEGVAVCCLDARTGRAHWVNDTSGTHFMARPHSTAMGGVAPHGYLAVNDRVLVVACGRSTPALFDKMTGRLLYHEADGDFTGGARVMATPEFVFTQADTLKKEFGSGLRRSNEDDEAEIFELATLVALDPASGQEVFSLRGGSRGSLSDDGLITLIGRGELIGVHLDAVRRAIEPKPGYISHTLGHFVESAKIRRWAVPVDRAYSLLQAGDVVIAGGRGWVKCLGATDGNLLWETEVPGQVRALCEVSGHLVVSTTNGTIACFAPSGTAVAASAPFDTGRRAPALPVAVAGYCIVGGDHDASDLIVLGQKFERVICVTGDRDPGPLRRLLAKAGYYGVRVVVQGWDAPGLPYTDYVADEVRWRLSAAADECPIEDLYRVLRPCGGVLGVAGPPPALDVMRRRLRAAGVPDAEITVGEEKLRVVRGAIPGTGEWTHQYADPGKTASSDETHVRLPLKAAWFGGLGPANAVSRHFRTPAPLVVDGRCIVPGLDHITALSIYNGRLLWQREFPDVAHWPAAYRGPGLALDSETVYVARDLACLCLDPATGTTKRTLEVAPELLPDETKGLEWEYLAVTDGMVVGAVGRPNLKRQWWSRAYPVNRVVFALDKGTGDLRWVYRSAAGVDSNAIAIDDGRVVLIDGLPRYPSRKGVARDDVRRLRALDLATGNVLWEHTDVVPTHNSLWMDDGVVVGTPIPFSRSMQDKRAAGAGGGITAYDASNGSRLWRVDEVDVVIPMILDGVFYTPQAHNLRTGRRITAPHRGDVTLRGGMMCSTYAGCPTLAMARFSSLGFVDLTGGHGTFHYSVVRPSCWINMIPAGGLVVVPEGGSSCQCAYNYKTSVALMSADRQYHYGIYSPAAADPEAVRLNFGAPGDRTDADGKVWFAWPRPVAHGRCLGKQPYGPKMARGPWTVDLAGAAGEWETYGRNPDWMSISGTDAAWLYACGVRGAIRLRLDLPDSLARADRLRVMLCFSSAGTAGSAGTRTVDIVLQQQVVLAGLDVGGAKNGRFRALQRVVDVPAGDALELELRQTGPGPSPQISGLLVEAAP